MNADGGPAFPMSEGDWSGMSLRDWFAGRETLADFDAPEASVPKWAAEALAGRQRPECLHVTKADNWIEIMKWEADWRAGLKYIRADAMLRARERGQEGDEENKALRDRVAQLEGVNDAALNTIDAAVGAVQRLSALDSYAKQVIDDDAWALHATVTIHPTIGTESIHPTTWTARYWDGVRTLEESALTIVEAIRALRAKVEGGGQ